MPYGFFVEVNPTDPGFGGGISGMHPGHDLPNAPAIPGNLPSPPPGVWPPITSGNPIVPTPPSKPVPPGTIWPPVSRPIDPGYGRPDIGAGHPDAGLPPSPGHPSGGPIPPDASTKPPSGTFWIVAGIPGVGWRYVCVDPSLEVGMPLPPAPAVPDNTLPPTATPRR